MQNDFPPLQLHTLAPGAALSQPNLQQSHHLKLNHPAQDVMTDLRITTAVTTTPETSIEDAENRMRRRGVRMLFVLDSEGALTGLITSHDLLGEKPLQFIERQGGIHREIIVANIMTPRDRLEVIKYSDVLASRIGHIVSTLQRSGRQHALVVDTVDGREMVRGLFSASRIARQLGMEISTTPVARTFAEIEKELMHFDKLA